MTFREFVKKECNQSWDTINNTTDNRTIWYSDYEDYCMENNATPVWDWRTDKQHTGYFINS